MNHADAECMKQGKKFFKILPSIDGTTINTKQGGLKPRKRRRFITGKGSIVNWLWQARQLRLLKMSPVSLLEGLIRL